MTRVTVDSYYIDDLQDYYVRNECIREQQYLSQEKLLHLAAFCISKASVELNECEAPQSATASEAALDVVRQLLSVINEGFYSGTASKRIVVSDRSSSNAHKCAPRATKVQVATIVEKSIARLRRFRAAVGLAGQASSDGIPPELGKQ
jgi:hypothetical protein